MADAIGVGLGQGVNADHTPSELSREVALTALRLLRRKVIDKVVFTGNSSFRINYEFQVSEAQSMMSTLLENRVDPARIFTENNAKDTVGNWVYTKLILEKLPYKFVYGIRPPHQGVRADYVAPMVLGPDYTYVGVDSKECLVGEDLKLTIQSDKIGLEIVDIIWTEVGIKPGESKKIQEILEKTHRAYAKDRVVELSEFITNKEAVRKLNILIKEQNLIRGRTTKYSMLQTKNKLKA